MSPADANLNQNPIVPSNKQLRYSKIIDIETGDFEVADTTILATDQLYERHPDAQPWVIRIGHQAVYRFGSQSLKKISMMQGFVNQRCEAILSIAVGYGNSPKQMIEGVIDTGFTVFLSLPLSVIAYSAPN
jgi:hypothetical protein